MICQRPSEEARSSASPELLIDQQQTASSPVEGITSSSYRTTSIDQQQTAGPRSAIEDQLQAKIIELEEYIGQLKSNDDPKREAVKHTLLEEDVIHLHKKILNLRVDLRLAREKQDELEKAMKEAVKNMSTVLDFANGGSGSATLELTTEPVSPDASLPSNHSKPTVEKPNSTPRVFQTGVAGSAGGFPSSYGTGQTNQHHAPKPLFTGSTFGSTPSSSRPFAKTPAPAVGKGAGFPAGQQANKSAPSMFGNPKLKFQYDAGSNGRAFMNKPGFGNNQEQSLGEARLRHYGLDHPVWPETLRNAREPTIMTLSDSASSSETSFPEGKKRKIGEVAEEWEKETLGTKDTGGSNGGRSFKLPKLIGDGLWLRYGRDGN